MLKEQLIHYQNCKRIIKLAILYQILFLVVLDVHAAFSKLIAGGVPPKSVARYLEHDMSALIIDRRLSRTPEGEVKRRNILKPRLLISDIVNAAPSNKIKTLNQFNLIINYTALRKTPRQEYGVHFDICLARSPHQFLLEGVLKTGDLRFENGLCVRDIYGGIDVQYALVKNEVFPNDIIQRLLKGESLDGAIKKDELPQALTWLEEFMLDTSIISEETVYSFNWLPML